VQRFLDADLELVSNVILRVELLRALRRAAAEESILSKAHRVLQRFNLRRTSEEILARAAELPPRSLRTIDAIHLATALDLSPPPAFFLCYDRRLAKAARHHGLAVVAPGGDEVHQP
jgi:predicted nucleic acid-binding protein